jgi:hypothetical protein
LGKTAGAAASGIMIAEVEVLQFFPRAARLVFLKWDVALWTCT